MRIDAGLRRIKKKSEPTSAVSTFVEKLLTRINTANGEAAVKSRLPCRPAAARPTDRRPPPAAAAARRRRERVT